MKGMVINIMFNDFIELQRQEMINNLISLIKIPSVASSPKEGKPFGEEIDNALEYSVKLAKKMGFKARNLGYCSEIIFGGEKVKNPEKVYIAGHLDVVPAGDGWTGDAFNATIRNGKIYGRGVLDDKGPSIAVLYAMKAIKSLGFEPEAEIRLILGGDEESGMNDLKTYIKENGLPDYGLTPDNCFPIVNAEVGVVFANFELLDVKESGGITLNTLQGGRAVNCVPDLCRAVLNIEEEYLPEVKKTLRSIEKSFADCEYSFIKNTLCLSCYGISAHGSVPETGKNAALEMIKIISILLDSVGSKNSYIDFAVKYFDNDTKGVKLGIECSDEISGALSLNLGICEYSSANKSAVFSMDMRVPVSVKTDTVINKLKSVAEKEAVSFVLKKANEGTHMPKDNPFLQKLASVYEKVSGKPAEFLSARGVTYAKCFEGKGVAFGPIDENDPSQGGGLHGKDEYLDINAYINIAKIYALAIYELWV